jgi:hypothetical protein
MLQLQIIDKLQPGENKEDEQVLKYLEVDYKAIFTALSDVQLKYDDLPKEEINKVFRDTKRQLKYCLKFIYQLKNALFQD